MHIDPQAPAIPNHEHLPAFLLHSLAPAFVKDSEGRYTYVNALLAEALGVRPQDVIGTRDADWFPPDVARQLRAHDEDVLRERRALQFVETFPSPSGSTRHFVVTKSVVTDAEGGQFIVGMALDATALVEAPQSDVEVTRQMAAERRLIENERRFRGLFDSNLGLMCTHDLQGRLLQVNGAAARALGFDAEALIGRRLEEFVAPAFRHQLSAYLLRIRKNGSDEGLMQLAARDGSVLTWKYRNAVVSEPGAAPYVLGTALDVTELKAAQEAAKQLSLTDELTGLVNRRGFAALGEQHIRLMRRISGEVLLLFADLDGLKKINDQYGHKEGSNAIRAFADLLTRTFRKTDVIARVGGDEFTVLVVNPQPGDELVLPQRLAKALIAYNEQNLHPYTVAVSVGTSRAKAEPTLSLERLLDQADAAMYERKQRLRSAS